MIRPMFRTTLLALACALAFLMTLVTPAAPVYAQRTIKVTGSLQEAINAALPGDVLLLAAKTYNEDILIRRAGKATAPITLRGAGPGRSIILGTIRVEASFWQLQDFEVNANGSDRDAIKISLSAHDIKIRRVHLHNGRGYGVRVGNDVARVLIDSCRINNFDAGEKDAHGVGIMTASDVTIRRCNISHTSGDAIQVNTPDYPGYNRFASTILIEQNQLHETRENALDIKSTHGLIARNNMIWGFHAVDTSDGMAIQVQYDARDIQLLNNQIWSAAEGIEVSRGSKNGTAYPLAPQRILIAGNLIRDLVADPNGDSGSGSGIVIRTSSEVRIYNNTTRQIPRSGVYVSVSQSGQYPQKLDIRNNALAGAKSDLTFSFAPKLAPGLIVNHNHYVGGRFNGGSLATWTALGYERHATTGNPQLDPNTLLPLAGSPLIDSGTNVGLPFNGAAPDRGWGNG